LEKSQFSNSISFFKSFYLTLTPYVLVGAIISLNKQITQLPCSKCIKIVTHHLKLKYFKVKRKKRRRLQQTSKVLIHQNLVLTLSIETVNFVLVWRKQRCESPARIPRNFRKIRGIWNVFGGFSSAVVLMENSSCVYEHIIIAKRSKLVSGLYHNSQPY